MHETISYEHICRIFTSAHGKLYLSVSPRKCVADLLVVSNFTLYADCASSRRPGVPDSAPFEEGKKIYELFLGYLRLALADAAKNGGRQVRLETGVFGSHMEITSTACGPVTVILDADQPGMIRA